jgi:PAS domain S-box-containing protein
MGVDKDKSLSTATAELRRQAEERLQAKTAEVPPPRTEEESLRLLHELQVHQIELEMQNVELLQARNMMEEALEKYTDLYDFAPVGYFTLDRDGVIHAANLGGAGLLGVERSRLLGRRFGLFVADGARPLFSEFLGKVFASQGKESREVPLTTEGNPPRFVQIEAVAFQSGQECRVAVIDITERKQVEEALHLETKFTDTVINSMPGIFYVFDDQERLIRWNKKLEDFSGHSPEGMPTLHAHDFVAQVSHKLLESKLSVVFAEHRNADAELLLLDREEKEIPFYCTGSPMTIGDRTFLVGLGIDITERKRAEEKLEILNTDLAAANVELEAFNYSVSHDLRKPLTVINSYCQVVQEVCGNILDDTCRGYIQEMYEGTLRMNRLIDTLLDFSRITRVEMHQDKVDLSGVAQEVAAGLTQAEAARQVAFRIAEGIVADGDASLLRVVLDNLLGNAWKYTVNREDALIEFGVTEIDGQPACFVRDNGPGFDMADAEKLFLPFQRLPGAEEFRGHGIGLATVERIIRRHGGKVWAEGEPGKGATFYFTLVTEPFDITAQVDRRRIFLPK